MKRQLNRKLFLCLVGCFAVLVPCAYYLHAFQVKRTAGFFLLQANAAKDKGDLKSEASYLSSYLAFDPKNREVTAQYALLLANDKLASNPRAMQHAYFRLEHALRLDHGRQDVRRKAIQVAMHAWVARFNDAAEHIDAFRKMGIEDAELLGWRAQCHKVAKEYKQARACYDAALKLPKKQEDHYIGLASLLWQEPLDARNTEKSDYEMFALADQTVEDMLTAFPDSFAAYLASADYYKSMRISKGQDIKAIVFEGATSVGLVALPQSGGLMAATGVVFAAKRDLRWERIARDIGKAVALPPPREAAVLLAAAELEMHLEKPQAALEYLKTGMELFPKDWRMYYGKARLEMDQKEPDAAVATLQSGLAKLPKNLDLLWNLAHLHLQLGQNLQADELITQLGKDGFPQRELDYLQARLLLNKEEWIKAVRILERIIPQMTAIVDQQKDSFNRNLAQECNFMLALCFQRMGDPDRAATTYGVIVQSNPLVGAGWLGLARMECRIGNDDTALSKYNQAMKLPQAPVAAWVECAQLLIHRNLKNPPANEKEAQAKWKEVEDLLAQAANFKLLAMEVAILKAEVMAAQNQFDQADALLRNEYTDATRPVEVWVKIAALEQIGGKKDRALPTLNDAESHVGDHVEIRIARARYWARQGANDAEQANAAVQALAYLDQNIEKWTPDEQRRLTEELASAYVRIGKTELAQGVWRKLAGRWRNDVGSRLMLFELAMQDKDEIAMAKMMGELKGIEGEDGTLWKYAKASCLILQAEKQTDKKALVEAETLLAVVTGRRARWYLVPIAQAHIHEQRGQNQAAMEKYRQAILWGSQNHEVILRAAKLLSENSMFDEAHELLRKLEQKPSSVGDVNRVAAEVAWGRQQPMQALTLARKAGLDKSEDYRDQILLGHINWAAGKYDMAEQRFLKAVKLAPANPQPRVALVQFFIRIGDKFKAVAAVGDAEKALTDSTGQLALAYCNELVGKVNVARQMHESALTSKTNDVAVLQAAAHFHLRQYALNVVDATPVLGTLQADVLFRLRQRDLEVAKGHFEKILALKSGSPTETAKARQLLAIILASSGNYQQTQKALEILGFKTETVQISDAEAKSNLADEAARLIILAQQPNPRQRQQAIAILEKLARLQVITSDEQFLLAQLYESVDKWFQAKAEMVRLLEATGENVKKQKGLEASFKNYLAQYCNSLLRQGAVGEVSEWLTKLEALEKDSLRTWSIKARLWGKQGNGKKAADDLTTLVAQNPDFKPFKLQVASLLEEIGQQGAAEEMFKDYVDETRSKAPENVLILAGYLGRQNRPDDALALCDKAKPDCKAEAVGSASVLILYNTKSTPKHWLNVAAWLESEIDDKKPNSKALLNNLAAVRRLQKDYDKQIIIYQRLLKLDNADALTMNNLAWTLALHSNDSQQAFKLIEDAIKLEGPREWLLDTRAVVFMKLGKADQALTDMEEVIAESPSASRYFHLAQAHHQAGSRQLALTAFEKAQSLGLKVDPLELPAYEQLLAAYPQLRKELDK